MARQDFRRDGLNEVCPSTNRRSFVRSHEPHRFHEVDQQHDRLLTHKPYVGIAQVGPPGPAAPFFSLVRVIVHVDPARQAPLAGGKPKQRLLPQRSSVKGLSRLAPREHIIPA